MPSRQPTKDRRAILLNACRQRRRKLSPFSCGPRGGHFTLSQEKHRSAIWANVMINDRDLQRCTVFGSGEVQLNRAGLGQVDLARHEAGSLSSRAFNRNGDRITTGLESTELIAAVAARFGRLEILLT